MTAPSAWCSPGLGGEQLIVPGRHWFVVDVETTGLNPAIDRLTEVAVVQLSCAGEEAAAASWLAGDGDAALAALVEELRCGLQDGVFVAHNARFDLAFLEADPRTAAIPLAARRWLCTLNIGGRASLAQRARAEGVGVVDPHTAAGDALTLARVLRVMLRRSDAHGLATVGGIPASTRPIGRFVRPHQPPVEGGWASVLAALPMVVPVQAVTREQRSAFGLAARDFAPRGPVQPSAADELVAWFRELAITRIALQRLLAEAGLDASANGWQDAALGDSPRT
jgi:DNA polymerase III epsilon subunit-like protein